MCGRITFLFFIQAPARPATQQTRLAGQCHNQPWNLTRSIALAHPNNLMGCTPTWEHSAHSHSWDTCCFCGHMVVSCLIHTLSMLTSPYTHPDPSLPPLSLCFAVSCSPKQSVGFIRPDHPVCLEACQMRAEAGNKEGSEVNRKSGGLCFGRKGRAQRMRGGGSRTWTERVRSMWERCQPQPHSRSEFIPPFLPLCSLLPPSVEIFQLWIIYFSGLAVWGLFWTVNKCGSLSRICMWLECNTFLVTWSELCELKLTFHWQPLKLNHSRASDYTTPWFERDRMRKNL